MRRELQKSRCGLVEKSVDMPKSFCQALCPPSSYQVFEPRLDSCQQSNMLAANNAGGKKPMSDFIFKVLRSGDKPYRIMPSQLSAQVFFTPFGGRATKPKLFNHSKFLLAVGHEAGQDAPANLLFKRKRKPYKAADSNVNPGAELWLKVNFNNSNLATKTRQMAIWWRGELTSWVKTLEMFAKRKQCPTDKG